MNYNYSLLEVQNDLIARIDPENRLTYVNDTCCKTFGKSREELIGSSFIPLVHEDDISDTLQSLKELKKNPHQTYKEQRVQTVYGWRWIHWQYNAIINEEGEMTEVQCVGRDITDLKESEARCHAILNAIPDFMFICDREGILHDYNVPTDSILTPHLEQFLGKSIYKVLPMDLTEKYLQCCKKAQEKKEAQVLEFILNTPGGTKFCEARIAPMDEQRFLTIARDVTNRKKAEHALLESKKKLQASEENYRLLADNTPDHIYSLDRELRFTAVNQSLCQTLSLESHEIIGKSASELGLPGETARELEELFLKVFNTGENLETEVTITVPEGSIRTYNIVLIPLFDEKGKVTSVTGTNCNITERKKLEQEIFKADKLESIGTMAGGIAHDFNNYLAVLLGNISLAKLYKDNPQIIMEKLEAMEQATARAKDLSSQLFAFAKGAAPVKKTVYLNQFLVDNVKFTLSGSNVCCNFFIDEELHPVDIDEGQFSQVISNIITNACQAMPEGGEIALTAENIILYTNGLSSFLSPGEHVRISIQDQGIGIEKKYLNKLFDPFFTTKEKGSGLGLATSYTIIKNHSGQIFADSQVGAGTTFYIYLPASNRVATPAADTGEILYGSGKILVMDDQEDLLELTREALIDLGYQASLARNGEEAINIYMEALKENDPFHLVIMDLTIPGGMGGKDTIKELLKLDPGVKAIVASGYSRDPVMANYQDYGFKGVIKKPFSLKELSQIVYKVIMKEQNP